MDFIVAISVAGLIFAIGLSLWLRRVLPASRSRHRRTGHAGPVRGDSGDIVPLRRPGAFARRTSHVNSIIELSGIGLVILAAVQWQLAERRRIESFLPTASPADDTHLHSTSAV